MHWIIEDNKESYTTQAIIEALEELSVPYSTHKIIPFIGEILGDMPEANQKVTCYGPYSMRNYLKKYNYQPGTYDLEDMDFNVQMHYWGDNMLNSDSKVLKFKDIQEWPSDEARFIRPIKDSKVFNGGYFEWEEFKDWQNKVVNLQEDFGDTLSGETLVQVAYPKNIYKEFRVWVVGGKVVETSQYRENFRLTQKEHDFTPAAVIDYVEEIVKLWKPHDVFVVDIALLKNGTKKVIEINTFNAAGFYKANVKKIITSIEEMEKRKDLTPQRKERNHV